MKQHLLTLFLALAASVAPLFAQSGTCGDNLTWTLDTESGILTIFGTGAMDSYSESSNAPWYSYRSSIKTVIIEDGVESIGDYAFYWCRDLTSVTIPNSVKSIGVSAFAGCSSLTSVTIPNSVTTIEEAAFYECSSLTSVTIPNSVTSIGEQAFAQCSSLTSVTIPNSVTSIGDYAFSSCSSLTSITIPSSVTSIGEGAFRRCSSLTSITIPNSVTSIGYRAFFNCRSLTSIAIPNSVTSIGGEAFHNCSSLTSIEIPNSVISIGYDAFYDCTGLTSVTIGNSVTSIGDYAFRFCSSLTSITIPNSVTSIGNYAFAHCSSLTSMIVENGNTKYDSRNNCNAIIETATNTLIAGCQTTIIPNSVTSIGDNAFEYCSSLTSITIPNSVTNIRWIAFGYCSSLTSITIPNSVTSIGGRAFEECSSLTSVTCEAVTPPTLENDVFYTVDKSIPLYVPAQSIDLYKAADQWKDFTNILPITVVGTFSVSATQQVTFAPGNLQYQASTDTWRFAEHQWDMVGMGYGQTNTDNWCYIGGTVQNSDNRQIGSNYNGWIDLFGWGTGNAPTKSSTDYSDYQTFVDWGTNPISNGGNQANMWRTLTKDEWEYLFNTRANASRKYGAAKVNGVTGVVVLPDNWVLPSGCGFTSGMTSASGGYDWNYVATTNIYTSAQWQLMESAGAVFLPAAGYRDGTTVNYAGSGGYYWSSTQYDSYGAYFLFFYSYYLYPQSYDLRYNGQSVRLVRAAQGEQEPVYSLSVSVEGEGTVTGAGEYKSGTTATLTATAASGYTFSQWSDGSTDNPRTITMTQNLTQTAVFVKKTFLVSFLNYDGSELQSSEVEAGTMPQYSGITPTKPADAQYTYTFAGWDKEIAAVTADATYTATYSHTVNKYTVTFMNGNKVLGEPQTVEYGQSATAPEVEIPQCRSLSWDKDFSKVTGNLTVKAVWTVIPLASGTCGAESDGSNLQWNLSCEGVLTIKGSGNMADYVSNEDVPWYAYRDIIISVNTSLSNVTSFGENAFSQCVGLTSISIPYDVESIGNNTFAGCSNLSSVTFESPNPPSIGTDCFAGCSCTFYVPCGAKEAYAAALNVEESRVKTYKPEPFTGGKKSSFSIYNNDEIRIGKSAFSDPEDWYYRNGNKFWAIKAQTNSNSAQYNYIQLYFWVDTDTELYTYGDGNQGVKPGTYSFQTPQVVQTGYDYYYTYYAWYVDGQYYNNCAIGLARDSYYGVCPASSWMASNYNNGFDPNYAQNDQVMGMNSATIVVKEGRDGHIYIEIWMTPDGKTIPELYITINEPKWEDRQTYQLTVNHTGNGSVDFPVDECGYKAGEQINITAMPDDGWTLSGWSGDCADRIVSNKDGTYTFTMGAMDCEVTAVFRQISDNIILQENEDADYYTQFAQDYNGRTVNTATLNRQFTQGKWATLCLPFDVNKALMTSLGLYNRVFELRYAEQLDDETIQMYFAPAQTLEAGKGYVVNPNAKLAAKTSFVFPNVTINTDSDNGDITSLTGYNDGTNRGNLFLVGTLRTGILQGTTTGNTYLGLKDNQLYYPNSTSGTPMRAYRAVFRSDIPVNASRLRIIADGESVSELEVTVDEQGRMDNGQLQNNATPARKYIDNGILYIERNGNTYNAQGQSVEQMNCK